MRAAKMHLIPTVDGADAVRAGRSPRWKLFYFYRPQ